MSDIYFFIVSTTDLLYIVALAKCRLEPGPRIPGNMPLASIRLLVLTAPPSLHEDPIEARSPDLALGLSLGVHPADRQQLGRILSHPAWGSTLVVTPTSAS